MLTNFSPLLLLMKNDNKRQTNTLNRTAFSPQPSAFWLLLLSLLLSLVSCARTETEIAESPPTSSVETTAVQQVSEEPIRVGILAIDSAVSVNERYSPLLNYLSEVTGRPFELIPLTQDSQFTEVAEGNLDFILNNPLAAVQIRRLYNTEFLTTHVRPQTGAEFSALIIVKRDSDIQTLEDLRGKTAACVDFETAAAGCVFQLYHLQKNGIDPFTDFRRFVENKSQDNIVLAVLNGTIEVGFIRTGQLEKMVNKGLINSTDAVRIINPANDNFYYKHTTALYPEWSLAALQDTDPQLVDKVKETLLTIPANHPALTAARLEKFTPAADYSELDRLIETLKLKSWNAKP
jgi:phosphate/phosphite/phosphonate ABC transporter binding protein